MGGSKDSVLFIDALPLSNNISLSLRSFTHPHHDPSSRAGERLLPFGLAVPAAGKWPLRRTGKGRNMSQLMGALTKEASGEGGTLSLGPSH